MLWLYGYWWAYCRRDLIFGSHKWFSWWDTDAQIKVAILSLAVEVKMKIKVVLWLWRCSSILVARVCGIRRMIRPPGGVCDDCRLSIFQ